MESDHTLAGWSQHCFQAPFLQSVGSNHRFYGELLHVLGELRQNEGRLNEAFPMLERALAIHRETTQGIRFDLAHVLFLIGTTGAEAHHSAVGFDKGNTVTVSGVVTRFVWRNPHMAINMDVTDESGETVLWKIEGPGTTVLSKQGFEPCVVVSLAVHDVDDVIHTRKHRLALER